MRRRPGIAGLQRGAQTRDQYKALGQHVHAVQAEVMAEQLATFKRSLEEFAIKHRQEIRQSTAFRSHFHAMCANIGVDPLVSNQSRWTQLLGLGDFYYELGVQIIEACLATRAHNGGLIDLRTLQRHVVRRRGSAADPVSTDDIVQAIRKLRALGPGFGVITVGGQRLVSSVPHSLNTDTNAVLELAQAAGHTSLEALMTRAGWAKPRAEAALDSLLRQGLAMVDDVPGQDRLYWFPCLHISDTASTVSGSSAADRG